MAQEELNESVEIINICSEILKTKQTKTSNQTANQKGTGMLQLNLNSNATSKGVKPNFKQQHRVLNVSRLIGGKQLQLPQPVDSSKSLETIYESVVPKRNSSSSEEDLLIGADELMLGNSNQLNKIDSIISEVCRSLPRDQTDQQRERDVTPGKNFRDDDDTMNVAQLRRSQEPDAPEDFKTGEVPPQSQVMDMIQWAEAAKARMFANTFANQVISPTAIVDEGYIVVGAHIDEQLVAKIKVGDYIDFGKLLPRDRILEENEGRMVKMVRHFGCQHPVQSILTILTNGNRHSGCTPTFIVRPILTVLLNLSNTIM